MPVGECACRSLGFTGGAVVKNPPAKQETWVRLLGQENPLEKEMATRTSILAWRIPGTEEPGGLQSMGLQESDITYRLNRHHHSHYTGQSVLLKVY